MKRLSCPATHNELMRCNPCLLFVILCTVLVLSAGCTGRQPPAGVPEQGVTAAATAPQTIAHSGGPGATVNVRIKENSFDPATLQIKKGTTVVWINEDRTEHTVTYVGEGPTRFDSGNIAFGQSFSNTFNTRGRYRYACTQHAFMQGTIDVE